MEHNIILNIRNILKQHNYKILNYFNKGAWQYAFFGISKDNKPVCIKVHKQNQKK